MLSKSYDDENIAIKPLTSNVINYVINKSMVSNYNYYTVVITESPLVVDELFKIKC